MKAVNGTVIIMDLDRFGDYVKLKGLSEYKPNIITGTLTLLIEDFVRKHMAIIIYGLDYERGTEEVVLELPFVKPNEILDDLEKIREEISRLNASISIGVAWGPISGKVALNRREAYIGVTRRKAFKALKKAKRLGGNRIIIA